MRLTRVFVAAELGEGSVVDLPPETASHVAKVLRARSGDELLLFNGDGRIHRLTLTSLAAFIMPVLPPTVIPTTPNEKYNNDQIEKILNCKYSTTKNEKWKS